MPSTLIRNTRHILTMDDAGTEISGGYIAVRDGWIESVGQSRPDGDFDDVVDASSMLALPGFVNTHHHLYQSLTRGFPESEGRTLFPWLQMLYPIWAGIDEEAVYASAQTGLAELLLSGCTTSSDHLYLFPRGQERLVDAEVEAARDIGARFHATRGSMDLSVEDGGLPPAEVVQTADQILADCERVVAAYHDPSPGALTRVALAPCSPFSVTEGLMRDSVAMARRLGVRLHTHIAETVAEDEYCLRTFGCRPVELLDRMEWLGPDVWLAHCIHLDETDIRRFAETGTSVSHCPTSNMLLSSGMAPVVQLLAAEVAVGLGVDGSASNDGGFLPGEIKQALLMARTRDGIDALTARDALRLATRGGAACLGRDDIGQIASGMCADLALFRLDDLFHAGAGRDPAGAMVLCGPSRAADVFVHGRRVVHEGRLITSDEQALAGRHNRASTQLLRRAGLA
ncbi:MAG TPA: 8-oxoguanine deaminase [Chloroflexota bacterium]|nr:8-oxoguanine deaminase [Chloroflexota bacterium]